MKSAKNKFKCKEAKIRHSFFALIIAALILFASNASAEKIIGFDEIRYNSELVFNSSSFNFFTDNTTRLYIGNEGLIGIGTANPSHKLEVAGAMNVTDLNVSNDLRVAGDLTVIGTSNLGSITINADNITVNNVVSGDGNISFYNSSGSEKMRIVGSSGWVGIGTANPFAALHVAGSINASGDICDGADNCLSTVSGSAGGWTDDGPVVRLTGTTDLIGVGTTNPDTKLHVAGNGTYTGDLVIGGDLVGPGTAGGSGAAELDWIDDGTVVRLATITDLVGIGTALPSEKLSVNGNVSLNNTLYVLESGNVGIGTASPSSKLHVVGNLNVSGTAYLNSMTFEGGNLSAELGTFTNLNVTGAAYLGATTLELGNITPNLNNTYSLGSPTKWWKDLYLANGSLYIAGTALSTSASGVLMWNGTAISNVAVQTGNNTVLGGAADEKVGIGTNTPSHKLEVAGAMNVSDLNVSNNLRVAGDLTVVGTSNLGSITISADNITVNNLVSRDGNISFYNASGSEKIRILDNGNIGIGTSTPTSALHVIGNVNLSNNVVITSEEVTIKIG